MAVVARPPAPAIPAEPVCDGLLVSVKVGKKPCIKPGSGESFKDCPDCPEMVAVPAGSFSMGLTQAEADALVQEYGKDQGQDFKRELPRHGVRIPQPFAVGRFAITRGQFAKFVKATGYKTDGGCWAWSGTEVQDDKNASWRSPGFDQSDEHPVVCVNWDDATAYAAWLAKTTKQPYRLLSEAEFEYAARAGTSTPFWWGKSISTSQANYAGKYTHAGSAKGESRQKTMPVKSFKPNPWGLYQVHGNVWTWTGDCWVDNYKDAPDDGSARATGDCDVRVLRGGSWYVDPLNLRAAYRGSLVAAERSLDSGFRLARTF